ncbi:histidine ammonia-lyase [Gelidibacter pelagius]|uniref:Histidine ammonia-lyase n=1 Tax=Gelidibacter pelagius TaxID=2819985 RepID=A0ABS3SVJ1_9FLAO|nr:histidine ammonia-lyase [Gelidibacter pelagius]MBO3099735.1 histidine ammonia-lyase [Gelidibacter pelagius]
MSTDDSIFYLGKDHLTARIALQLARGELNTGLAEETLKRMKASSQLVAEIVAKNEPVYGINTGFGPLCTTQISKEATLTLQENIIKSHSVGVGNPISEELALLMLVLKVHALAKGYSGISITTFERILWFLKNQIAPIVPEQGSLGASGDLAPLAHLFLPLLGLGEVIYNGKRQSTKKVYKEFCLEPITLKPKEGLALINGTQFIGAHAVEVIDRLKNCLDHADIIGALMLEAVQGSAKPFYPELHQLRPFKGNQHVAGRIKSFVEGSKILSSHKDCNRVQDPYSLRCIPQVHGASRNAWLHLKELLEVELNSVTDNPVLIDENLTISGGNFHGQPLAMALDYATLAASELGNISDRRVYLSLEGKYAGVPKLLLTDTGINSGYMILQYTTAALASENKGLCFPASADSIPSSLGQEDHVSMGSISGRKALQVIQNVERILSIEMLSAAQAFDFRGTLRSSIFLEKVHKVVREKIAFAKADRVFSKDIEKAHQLLQERALIAVYQQCVTEKSLQETDLFQNEFQTM